MDLDDTVIHYLIMGVGLACGSLMKTAFDWLSKTFWKKVIRIGQDEYEQFQVWKKSQGK